MRKHYKRHAFAAAIALVAAAACIVMFFRLRQPTSETDLVDAAIKEFRAQPHNPNYDSAIETQAVDRAAMLFGPFMLHEGLSVGQKDRLRPLVTRRIYLILKYNADNRGLKDDDPRKMELHKSFAEAQRQLHADIRQVLTLEQNADFEEHTETLGWRADLGPYLRKLESSGLGLTWEEEIQLLKALKAATSEPLRQDELGKPRGDVLRARLEKASQEVLSPPRYDRLVEYIEPLAHRYTPQMP